MRKKKNMDALSIAMFGQKRIPSREGGVEIVVEELSKRMVKNGNSVTCYNRRGHHVSGSEFDSKEVKNYEGINIKTVPTIEKKDWRQFLHHFLQRCVVLLESMMLFIFMLKDRLFFHGFLNYFIKEL